MTDREMLELAAKSAGKDLSVMEYDQCCGGFVEHKVHGIPRLGLDYSKVWGPIEHDCDAMELAASMHMILTFSMGGFCRAVCRLGPFDVDIHDDKPTAMRRAIVLAAAEVGKRMP